MAELEEAEGTQNFLNGIQNYPLLRGVQTNLYKCFMPIAWRLSGSHGVTALLHPEGPYDDPKGGALREAVYSRLRAHFGFINELLLFAEVDHHAKYSVNIYGSSRSRPVFDQVANLFSPATVEACYRHDGSGTVGGLKDAESEWNIVGHWDRIIRVDDEALAIFATLYDEPGTPPRRARLPALHASSLNDVLRRLAAYPRRLADLGDDYVSTEMWHETMQQKDGTISRRSGADNGFAADLTDWVLSGPHFFVANPFNKTPRRVCNCERALQRHRFGGSVRRLSATDELPHNARSRRVPATHSARELVGEGSDLREASDRLLACHVAKTLGAVRGTHVGLVPGSPPRSSCHQLHFGCVCST